MTSLDAVLFDLGNVLLGWDPAAALAGVLDPAEADRVFRGERFLALNHRLDAGLPWDDAIAEVRATDPALAELVAEYRRRYPAALTGPVAGMTELVDELRSLGLRLVGLTNWSAETYVHAVPAAPVIGRLDGVVVSGQEGLAKPDPRIFALAAARYALDPERTLFVDDSPPNVEAARHLGFRGTVFTGAAALRGELRRLGVGVGAA